MEKYYDKILLKGMSYDKAVKESFIVDGDAYIARGYKEIHFMNNDDYYILFADGSFIKNPYDIDGIDEEDWMIITVTTEAYKIIQKALDM